MVKRTWYVFLGDWLWWGYGINPAITPKMVKGSISMWVVSGVASPSYKAIYNKEKKATEITSFMNKIRFHRKKINVIRAEQTKALFSSLTSRYSSKPSRKKSSNVRTPSWKGIKLQFHKVLSLFQGWKHMIHLQLTLSYDAVWFLIFPCQQWPTDDKLYHHQKLSRHNAVNMFFSPLRPAFIHILSTLK